MSHDNGHSDPVSLDSFRQARRPRPSTPSQSVTAPRPATGMSAFLRELVQIAIEVHEAKHHGGRSA
jgi:hypothetical protein